MSRLPPGSRAAASRGALAWLAAALVCAAACATRQQPRSAVVERIEFLGNEAVASSELRAYLLTETPSWKPWKPRPELDEATLAEDMVRISRLYRRHGYFETSAEYALRWEPSRDAASVEVRIDEGPPVILSRWSVDLEALPGGVEAWRERLLAPLPLREGEVFSLDSYEAAKRELRARLADAGYPRAELEGGAEVDAGKRVATIAWRVEPGEPVHFGSTDLSGLDQVDERLVRRELGYETGDLYSARALRDSEKRIYDLGLFRSVSVRSRPRSDTEPEVQMEESSSTWPVQVEVVERPPRSVRAGIGYGSEEGIRAMLGWQRRNFLGQARLLELTARHSSLLQGLEASLAQPRFLDGKFRLRTSTKLEREHAPSFDADRASVDVSLTRPLFGAWSGSLGYELEWNDVTDVSLATEQALDDPQESVLLSSLKFGLERKTLQGGIVPSRGSLFSLSADVAPAFLGSQHSFVRSVADWRSFFPLRGTVLALRLRAGAIQPLPGTQADELPLVVRFFSGGSNSVRGFDYQELGPVDAQGEPLGGATLAEGSLELRLQLWRELGGVVFLDAGQVDLEPYHWKFDEISYATGTGLRYDTPIGPLRVDFGWVLNPADDTDRFRIHFAIGHAF